MAVLIGMSGDVKGQTFEIDKDEIRIGRSQECAIILNNPTVSGVHCIIHRDGDRYTVTDEKSTNGTRVNSKEISESALKPKDLLLVGSVEFMFDGENVEAVETHTYAEAQVEVAPGPATAPASFENISPFGTRRKESKGMWFLLITVIGALALIAVIAVFVKLAMTG
jgi:pSer/pThr/pTyr-binding forkhead associated (FHA) protein